MYRFFLIPAAVLLAFFGCKPKEEPKQEISLNPFAEEYVRLALTIGQYDEAFVDAYYGPDSLKPMEEKQETFPKDSLLGATRLLSSGIQDVLSQLTDSTQVHRGMWLLDQLKAFDRRIRIYSGETDDFDAESADLFGVAASIVSETELQKWVQKLDTLLPGKGSVASRFQTLANKFILPKDKLDTVFAAAIAECRKRTLEHYDLPDDENFKLEFVTNKSWNGYNWYQGNYQSLIQINTDLDIFIDRAIDVGSHESYPGHHVYNMLLEKNLYKDKGYVEMSVYPLYSPQSLIAEGTANYGIDVVFPGDDKIEFAKEVLLPLAGIDTTGIALYFRALEVKTKLNYVRNEVGRMYLKGNMDQREAMRWLQEYGLYNEATAAKSLQFITTYRSYVINYNYGMDLVKAWVEKKAGSDAASGEVWELFGTLMQNQVRIEELLK